jgi:hypothetical protein
MPRTLTQQQARYASLTHWKPGSSESQEAGRDFWCAKAIQDLQDSLTRSPLPFTDEQRQRIAALMLSGDPAPESTSTP